MRAALILYASFDGQTEYIARRIATRLDAARHSATVLPVDDPDAEAALERHEVVILGGAVRYGRHPRELESFVHRNLPRLAARPSAFFSVSMSAARSGEGIAQAGRYVDGFIERTGWHPGTVALFAGALQYTRYNPFVRFMMRLISTATGGSTDTSRDHEYTDWSAVDRFAGEQCTALEAHAAAA